ncbi:MAG: DUF5106 domain-containing protein [Tannerella sp.]|jgi:hypothetical protein|nr:DUF5106 domain-containing protein [Tannerella sp.]
MKKVIFLISTVLFFGCNNKSAQSGAPSAAGDFERVIPPVFMKDITERANFFVTHFWDHFNFKDTAYVHNPDNITEQAFVDFIYFFRYASPDKIREGVAKLMKSAEADSVMFAYFSREAEHYLYEPNSPFRNDEHYIPFLEQFVNSSIIGETYKIRARYILNLARKNRPGNKAEDIQYTLANGKQGHLYGIKSDYLLLIFHNPGCDECRNAMDMIRNSAEISPLLRNGTLKILAVYADENLDKWKEHIAEIPSNWINGYDKSLNIREKETYDLKAIPTLYLLDKDKKVVLKDCSVENVNEFFKK